MDSGSTARSSIRAGRRAEIGLGAALSAGAAAIHLAAGPGHVETLGDLGLGFYWAAVFQAAFAVALFARPRSRRLAWTGIGLNLALIGAWAWSRVIGLPAVPGGPEAVGIADGTAVVLQIALIGLLSVRLFGFDMRLMARGSSATNRSIATSGFIVVVGVVLLSTTLAVADAAGGHAHRGGEHEHASPIAAPVGAEHGHGVPTAP